MLPISTRYSEIFSCKRIECDEIWSFVHANEGHLPELQSVFGYGDVYTWVAIDADIRLVSCWNVGLRDAISGEAFIKYLASHLALFSVWAIASSSLTNNFCATDGGSATYRGYPVSMPAVMKRHNPYAASWSASADR